MGEEDLYKGGNRTRCLVGWRREIACYATLPPVGGESSKGELSFVDQATFWIVGEEGCCMDHSKEGKRFNSNSRMRCLPSVPSAWRGRSFLRHTNMEGKCELHCRMLDPVVRNLAPLLSYLNPHRSRNSAPVYCHMEVV
jgi:hypothetical protein